MVIHRPGITYHITIGQRGWGQQATRDISYISIYSNETWGKKKTKSHLLHENSKRIIQDSLFPVPSRPTELLCIFFSFSSFSQICVPKGPGDTWFVAMQSNEKFASSPITIFFSTTALMFKHVCMSARSLLMKSRRISQSVIMWWLRVLTVRVFIFLNLVT